MAAPKHLSVSTWPKEVAGDGGMPPRLTAAVQSVEARAATQLFLWSWGVRWALHLLMACWCPAGEWGGEHGRND